MTITPVYTTAATATGGRDGRSKTHDGSLDVKLGVPVEMGGKGEGNNPEQLFAAGYAACYLGAMKFATTQDKSLAKVPADTTVTAKVGIGPRSDKGFGIKVDIEVTMPGLDKAEVQKIADAGHEICPYSNAIKGNVAVTTSVA
ncbi:organic hydroperoxide resistance protein [Seohaeicola zhoushanensis]|uniref:Organic hydroperoxide resistance protein n=1 Tax=Seohaeicola zhoushanensis TaxID=1569283 RepID=A0A8J3GUQ0_9RHOB|nr:organic hydroperoxide resistance protein [Seohaeicola zhoushanensis]GHF38017.1 organic hydroperoxide resistance protein [Seohaeicola zhoushanensis]